MVPRSVSILAPLLLLSGCVGNLHPTSPQGATLPAWTTEHAVAVEHCANAFGDSCWEASMAALPNGTLVAADGFAQSISRSFDDGRTWARIARPGQPVAQLSMAPGWSDTDSLVTATPDGKLVFSAIAATYNDAPDYLAGAATLLGIHVAVSKDAGTSWVSNMLLAVDGAQTTSAADRQWVAGGPKGELYLAYAHYRGTPLFYAYAGIAVVPAPFTDDTEEVARSDDAGQSWSAFRAVDPPAPPATTCQYAGAPVVAADGSVAIPLVRYQSAVPVEGGSQSTCVGDPTGTYAPTQSAQVLVERSTDGGATFHPEKVATAAGPDLPSLFPVLAGSPDGALVAGWDRFDGRVALSVRSSDGHWGTPVLWTPAGGNVTAPPGLVAGPAGAVRISYVTNGTAYGNATLRLAWGNATGPAGNVTLWGPTLGLDRANGDFATLVQVPDGRLASAFAVYDMPQRTFHVMALLATPPPGTDV